jgi:hypothetical protein
MKEQMHGFPSKSVRPALVLLLGLVGTASAQPTAFSCIANAAVPPTVRAEGLTEFVSDIVISCTGGIPTPTNQYVPQINFTVFLNTGITSRTYNTSTPALSEALLLVDEPGTSTNPFAAYYCNQASNNLGCRFVGLSTTPGIAYSAPGFVTPYCGGTTGTPACPAAGEIATSGRPNAFAGLVSGNQVSFIGVPVDAPGPSGNRIFRITNIRANASGISAGLSGTPGTIQALVSASGATSVPISNPSLLVGFVQSGLTFTVRKNDNSDVAGAADIAHAQCNSVSRTAGTNSVILRYQENFPTAFKLEDNSGNQNIPGQLYNTESDFFQINGIPNAPVGSGATTSMVNVGHADYATRLKAVFNNIPAGVSVYASTSSLSSAASAVLMTAEGAGATPAPPTNTDFLCAGACTGTSPGFGTQLPVTNGTAIAVWQVTGVNNLAAENYQFYIWFSYTVTPASNSPAPGTSTATGSFAPTPSGLGVSVSTAAATITSLPVPRFTEGTQAKNWLTIYVCSTSPVLNCTRFNFNPTSASFLASGGSGTVTSDKGPVTDGIYTGCAWVASSNVPWITIMSGGISNATGYGVVVYRVAPNTSPLPRTGTITFSSGQYGSAQYTITQAVPQINIPSVRTFSYRVDNPSLLPPPQLLAVTAQGGANVPFVVTTATFIPTPTSIPSFQSWLHVNRTSGVTPTTVTVSVDPAGLPQGSYLGFVTFHPSSSNTPGAASRAATSNGGSTTAIIFAVGPQAPLIASPDSFTLDSGSARQDVQVTTPLGAGSVPITATAVTIDGPDNFLNLSRTTGNTNTIVGVSINQANPQLAPYLGIVAIVNSMTGVGKMVQVRVNATSSGLASDTDGLSFVADASGVPPPPQSIVITSPRPVTASVVSDSSWLSVQPSTFTTPAVLSVAARPGILTPADYPGQLQLTTSDTELDIPVVFSYRLPSAGGPSRLSLSHIADGQFWKTTITLVNRDVTPANFTLNFWAADGSPLNVTLEDGSRVSHYENIIPVGGARTIATAGTGNQLSEGWAEVVSQQLIGGMAIFRQRVPGRRDFEAASPLVPNAGGSFLLPFDNTQLDSVQRFVTSMALVNPSTQSTNVAVRIRNAGGTLLGNYTVPMGGRNHRAFALTDLFPAAASIQGVAEFQSNESGLTGLGLRFNPGGAFTSLPVLPSTEISIGGHSWLAAQIADGNNWKTSVTVLNGDVTPSTALGNFYTGNGSLLTLNFDDLGAANALQSTIQPGGSATASTTGTSANLSQGWLALSGAHALGGLAIFRQRVAGIPDFEAASPFARYPVNGFLLPFDNTPSADYTEPFVTTMALVNPAQIAATISVSIRDENGNQLGTHSLLLPQTGQTTFTLKEQFPETDGRRGVAEFSCPTGVGGLGLRFNPQGPFTSLPTIPR